MALITSEFVAEIDRLWLLGEPGEEILALCLERLAEHENEPDTEDSTTAAFHIGRLFEANWPDGKNAFIDKFELFFAAPIG